MENERKQDINLTDEELMNIVGGAYSDTSSCDIITPLYGIIPVNDITLKYGIRPMYGIKPPVDPKNFIN
jgi:hypothetical protein